MTPRRHAYPTPEHARAAEEAVALLAPVPGVEAVLLTCSCARGRATPDSCLDLSVLAEPARRAEVERAWEERWPGVPAFRALAAVGRYAHVDLIVIDGEFAPGPRSWTGGPDAFELELGNALAYGVPLWTRGDRLEVLRRRWLPYYGEALRAERLAAARRFCLNDLDHIPLYVARGLHFQSLGRLWDAFRGFLQGLFIARRTYPIAYDKWIREQVEELLGLPELYARLPGLFEIGRLESDELAGRAADLRALAERYLVD